MHTALHVRIVHTVYELHNKLRPYSGPTHRFPISSIFTVRSAMVRSDESTFVGVSEGVDTQEFEYGTRDPFNTLLNKEIKLNWFNLFKCKMHCREENCVIYY